MQKKRSKVISTGKYSKLRREAFWNVFGKRGIGPLLCQNGIIGVIVDRFGRDVKIRPVDEDHFQAKVEVVVSNNFFGWVLGLGEGVTLIGPEDVAASLREEVQRMYEQYR